MPEDELKVYIEKLLKMGYETHIIKEHLVKAGHHHKKVDHNIHNLIEVIHTDLIEYVESELKKGNKLIDIMSDLKNKGHPTHKLNHIHKYYEIKHQKKIILENICTKYAEESLGKTILWILLIILGITLLGFIAGYLYLDNLQIKEILSSMTNNMSIDESNTINAILLLTPAMISIAINVAIIVGIIGLILVYIILKQFVGIKHTNKEISKIIINHLTVPFLFIVLSLVVNIVTLLIIKDASMIVAFLVPIVGFGIYFYNINQSINQHRSTIITITNAVTFILVISIIGIIALYFPPKIYEFIISTMGFSL